MKRTVKKPPTRHVIRPHHHKPYLRRHIGLAGVGIGILIVSAIMLGLRYATQPFPVSSGTPATESQTQTSSNEPAAVRFPVGYSANFDIATLAATATPAEDSSSVVSSDDSTISDWPLLSKVSLSPRPGINANELLASRLTIRVETSSVDITAGNPLDLLLLPPETISATELTNQSTEQFADIVFNRYEYATTLPDSNRKAFAIAWQATLAEQEFIITLDGLAGSNEIPPIYAAVLDTIAADDIFQQSNVELLSADWVAQSSGTRAFLSDLVSPAVVKVYHLACGTVRIQDQAPTDQQCRAVTGSGFVISNDGYIATNGHVAVYEPEDALVDALLQNPLQLSAFLTDVVGLNSSEISQLRADPQQLAAAIAELYELPDGAVKFEQKREVLLVSLGNRQLNPTSEEEINNLFSFENSYDIKRARLVDFNYSGKDQLNLLSGSDEGFTQSDVALLKVDISNAPLLRLGQPADISQGQSIAIIGFPSDAENQLVDTSELAASITLGTISSIRTAAGGSARLFQTDTDASVGNSGGPAVNDRGHVLGLLTYRFKDDVTQNAAKSYLRDVADLRDLVERNNFVLDTNSRVQAAWSEGLHNYSRSRFSKAIPLFEEARQLYPAHRLAASYIASAEQNIAAGKDVAGSAAVFYLGLVVGAVTLLIAIRLIARHHAHHHIYRAAYGLMPDVQTNKQLVPSEKIIGTSIDAQSDVYNPNETTS
jgi:S1-C subfamily serine protease